jgi:hypothetical protein
MARIRNATEARFIRHEAKQLARHAPPLAEAAGQPALEKAVQLGLAAARRAGFTEAPQIRLYLRLMTSFGSHFDTDPQYQFLRELLQPEGDLDAIERARLLYWHATQYFARVFGSKREHAIAAATCLSELDVPTLAEAGADYDRRGPDLLASLHPRRIAWLPDRTVRRMMDTAAEDAARHGLGGPAGAPLLLSLMFSFGHRVTVDPLYPWVRQTLSDTALSGPDRTEALAAATRHTISSMLSTLREALR